MPNTFLTVPVPASESAGAPVNVAALGPAKTFELAGTLIGVVALEGRIDTTEDFAPLVTIRAAKSGVNSPSILVRFVAAVAEIRANTLAYELGTPTGEVGAVTV